MREVCESLRVETNARGVVFVARDGFRTGAGAGRDADLTELLAATSEVDHEEWVQRATADGPALACSLTSGYLVVFFNEMPDWRAGLAVVKAVREINRRFVEPQARAANGTPGSGTPARR